MRADILKRLERIEAATSAPEGIDVIWRQIVGADGKCDPTRARSRCNPSAGDLKRASGETLDAFQVRARQHFSALERSPILSLVLS